MELLSLHFRRPRGFTLIELLVVISIVAMLVAILLPTLSETKQHTRRVMTSSNIRQLSVCFTSYTNDFKSYYPTPPTSLTRNYYNTAAGAQYAPHAGSFSRCYTNQNVSTADRTIYNAANNYGGMPATAHPSVGSPMWTKSAFTDPTLTGGASSVAGVVPLNARGFASPYALFFGFKSAYTPAAGNGQAWKGTPDKSGSMTPMHNLVGDLVTAKPQGGATGTSYLFTHARNADYRRVWNENHPSESDSRVRSNSADVQYRQDFVPTAQLPSEMVGAYMGKADGSVKWYPTSTMVVALTSGQQYNSDGLYFKLYGGGFGQGAVDDF